MLDNRSSSNQTSVQTLFWLAFCTPRKNACTWPIFGFPTMAYDRWVAVSVSWKYPDVFPVLFRSVFRVMSLSRFRFRLFESGHTSVSIVAAHFVFRKGILTS